MSLYDNTSLPSPKQLTDSSRLNMSPGEPYSAYGLGIQGMVRDGQASAATVAKMLHTRVAERHSQRERAEAHTIIALEGRSSRTTRMCKPLKALRAAFQRLPRLKPCRLTSATTSSTTSSTRSSTVDTSAAGDTRPTRVVRPCDESNHMHLAMQSRTKAEGPHCASVTEGLDRALAYLSRRIKARQEESDTAKDHHAPASCALLDAPVQTRAVITVGQVSRVYTSLELVRIYIAHICSHTLQAAVSTTCLRWPHVCAPYSIICAFHSQLRHSTHGFVVLFSAAMACGMAEADATQLTQAVTSRSHPVVRGVAPLPQLNLPPTTPSAITGQPALFNGAPSSTVDSSEGSLNSSLSAALPASCESRPTCPCADMTVEEGSVSSGATSAEMASVSGASTGGGSAHTDPITNSKSIDGVGCWEERECAGVGVAQESDNSYVAVSLSLPWLWRASGSPPPTPNAYPAPSRPSIFCSASPSSAASMWYHDGVWHEREEPMVITTAARRCVEGAGDGLMDQSDLTDAVTLNRRGMEDLASNARESNLVIRRDGKVMPMLDMPMIPQEYDAGDVYGAFSPLQTCSHHAGEGFAAPTPSAQRSTGKKFVKLFYVSGNRGSEHLHGQRRGPSSTRSCISDVTMGHDLDPTCWNLWTTWWWNFVHGGVTSESLAPLQYEVHVVDEAADGKMGSIRLQRKKAPKKTKGIKAIPRRIRRALLRATLACSDAAVAVSSAIGHIYLSLPSLRPQPYEEPPNALKEWQRLQLYKHWQQYAAEVKVEEEDGGVADVDDCEYSY